RSQIYLRPQSKQRRGCEAQLTLCDWPAEATLLCAGSTPEALESRGIMRKVAVLSALLFLLFVAGSFLYVEVTKALDRTPCCADDAYFSLVAKNLALHGSYSVPRSSETVSLFDPEITSGPGLILPGAAMIALVGARPWATSLTTILLFAATL